MRFTGTGVASSGLQTCPNPFLRPEWSLCVGFATTLLPGIPKEYSRPRRDSVRVAAVGNKQGLVCKRTQYLNGQKLLLSQSKATIKQTIQPPKCIGSHHLTSRSTWSFTSASNQVLCRACQRNVRESNLTSCPGLMALWKLNMA